MQHRPRTAVCNSFSWSLSDYRAASAPSTHVIFRMQKGPDMPARGPHAPTATGFNGGRAAPTIAQDRQLPQTGKRRPRTINPWPGRHESPSRGAQGWAPAHIAMRASERFLPLANSSAAPCNNDADLLCDLKSGPLTGDHPTTWSPTGRGREQRPAIDSPGA